MAILDATNSNTKRRRVIEAFLKENLTVNYKIIYIESICTIPEIIEKNILKTKVNSPDYKNWADPEKAAEDFRKRISQYEKSYESLTKEKDGEDVSYIQTINQGSHIIMRNLRGYFESKLLSYLINLHTGDRPIFFTRHGETENNRKGIIGGDPALSETGEMFAQSLANFFQAEKTKFQVYPEGPIVYSSTLRRALHTAEKLSFLSKPVVMKNLDDINAGLRDSLSYEEIKEKYPQEYEERCKDKLNYRYPRGESYMDVIRRMEPIIYELERRRGPAIIVGHRALLRCLYGYFACIPIEQIPAISIPLHMVIKFIPEAYGFYEERFDIDPITGTASKRDLNTFTKYEE